MLIRSAPHDVIARVFLLISRLEIMRTNKHESKSMLTHTNTHMTRIFSLEIKLALSYFCAILKILFSEYRNT